MNGVPPDAEPVAPERPLASDCCDGGCDRCVFDIYEEELAAYQRQLDEWRVRQDARAG